MYTIDETHWPLVVLRSSGMLPAADYPPLRASWERWLGQNTFFAVLAISDNGSFGYLPGAASGGAAWLRRHAQPLAQLVALALVVPPNHFSVLRNVDVRKATGLPGRVFDAEMPARAWLHAQLAAHGVQSLPG